MNLSDVAYHIVQRLHEEFGPDIRDQQVLCVAEEAGEFVGAYRRWSGQARRIGTEAEVITELADIIIAAYCTAQVFDWDLPGAIASKVAELHNRGWRDERP